MQEQQPSSPSGSLTFRDLVDLSIVFGCIPALVLNMIGWAIATAFPQAGVLVSILALLITLLLALIGILLIIRYVDVSVMNGKHYNDAPTGKDSEGYLMASIGAGAVCLFFVASIIACLSTAGMLESWHYALMGAEVLLVGYQTWRVFLGHQH